MKPTRSTKVLVPLLCIVLVIGLCTACETTTSSTDTGDDVTVTPGPTPQDSSPGPNTGPDVTTGPDVAAPNDVGASLPELPSAEDAGAPTVNFYDNLPDYANLPVAEAWQFEAETTGPMGNQLMPGMVKGAVEVIDVQGTQFLYVHEFDGVRILTSEDGINWENPDGGGVSMMVTDSGDTRYSHPYGAIAPDGSLQMFLQSKPTEMGKGFFISRTSSTDGFNFSEPEDFLKCDENPELYARGCGQCAHGRVAQLVDGSYIIAFSASCQVEEFKEEWAPIFVPGTLLAYSDDLITWDIDPDTYFPACHDPTFDVTAERVSLYCASEMNALGGPVSEHMKKQGAILRYDSTDGTSWDPSTPAGVVQFFDAEGNEMLRMDWDMADVDTHTTAGQTRLYVALHDGEKPTVYVFHPKD